MSSNTDQLKSKFQFKEHKWKETIWVSTDNRVKLETINEVKQFIKLNPRYKISGFWACIIKPTYQNAILCPTCHIAFCVYPYSCVTWEDHYCSIHCLQESLK